MGGRRLAGTRAVAWHINANCHLQVHLAPFWLHGGAATEHSLVAFFPISTGHHHHWRSWLKRGVTDMCHVSFGMALLCHHSLLLQQPV